MGQAGSSGTVLAVVPVKAFGAAKERLGVILTAGQRRALAAALAARVTSAWLAAGHEVVIVAGDDEAAAWGRARDLEVIGEPAGGGLDGSAAAGIGLALARHRPWCVSHADLPLFDAADAAAVAAEIRPGRVVLAPSRDGGTNLVAGTAGFEFAYGRGSFARHLDAARRWERVAVVRTGTALDLDGPDDLTAAMSLQRGRWLASVLGWPP